MTIQLLQNSHLVWDASGKTEFRTDETGVKTVVEIPPFWEYVSEAVDGKRFPYSFHKDNGFEIGVGNRKIRAGYAQPVHLKPGQRYLAKAVFTPEIYADGTVDPNAVNVFFRVDSTQGGLTRVDRHDHFVQQTVLFVFQVTAAGKVKLSFWLDSKWPLREVKMRVHSLEIEEVASDYGTPVMITPAVLDQVPAPPPPAGGKRAVAIISTPPPVNIRATKNGDSADVGDLYNGELIDILGVSAGDDGKQWLQVRRLAHDTTPEVTGYVTLGNGVVRWQELTVNAPTPAPENFVLKSEYDRVVSENNSLAQTVNRQLEIIRERDALVSQLEDERTKYAKFFILGRELFNMEVELL